MRGALTRTLATLSALALPVAHVGAQAADSLRPTGALGCPSRQGDAGVMSVGTPRATIDTTLVLAIDERRWRRESYAGGIAFGAGAPATVRAPWSACAGAAVQLGRATALLRGVRGVVRLRGDRSSLASPRSTTGTTPPAGPPRR